VPRTLLLKNATAIATMDDAGTEIADGAVLIEDNRIVAVGPAARLPATADEVIDLTDHVLLPGLVNTHHHMFQCLTRATPGGQDVELFGWLSAHYAVWARITPEMFHVAAKTAMAELILSGCTTAFDHQYLYVNGATLDHAIEAAADLGMRFHASRGAMSVGESGGGLPPDAIVEREPAILKEMQRLVERWHDPSFGAMLRIVLAPCSPFTVTDDLMIAARDMARSYGVSLHTHLAENDNDVAYSLERYGKTPTQYVEDLGWVGRDVWHAHCVKLDEPGIKLFGRTGTGVAHCPCSNMRLASGIAPVKRMLAERVPVGLGVDGSASNDSGHLMAEARQAMLAARAGGDPGGLTARDALRIATRGGAEVLNRTDIGQIAPGFAADMVAFDLTTLGMAGQHDPVAAAIFCQPQRVNWSIINGRVIVREGHLVTLDERAHALRHRTLATRLYRGE
jgi:cytosine/adenosine deaminase-related metal-dependent hydrolase